MRKGFYEWNEKIQHIDIYRVYALLRHQSTAFCILKQKPNCSVMCIRSDYIAEIQVFQLLDNCHKGY